MEGKGAQRGAAERPHSAAGQREGGTEHHADSTTPTTAEKM